VRPGRWRLLAVGLAGAFLASLFVAGSIGAANPRCCGHGHPYVTLYDRDRSQIEALLVTGDGQAFGALAQDPLLAHPGVMPAPGEYSYRAQRPVWGYLAWMASFGQAELVGWVLAVLTVVSFGLACAAAAALLAERGASPWWALLVILAAQETLSSLTPELLAFALLALGVMLWERDRRWSAVAVLCIAVLTRESIVVGIVALGAWELWSHRGDGRAARRRALPLAVPCATYFAWIGFLRVRLGTWPSTSSHARLTAPGVGLLDALALAHPRGLVVGVLVAIGLCVAAVLLAPRDPLTWIAIGFAAFATTFNSKVWLGDGFTRTLIPLYACAATAFLGALHRRHAAAARRVHPRSHPRLLS
jgi:hypothetical protein